MVVIRIVLLSALVGVSAICFAHGLSQECPAHAQGIFIANMKMGGC